MKFSHTLLTDPISIFGALMLCLGVVFYLIDKKQMRRFFFYVPALFLCYFLPALLNTFNVINTESPEFESVYDVAKNFFLPSSLLLLTLGVDLKALLRLGYKPLVMFFAGTVGIILGGPLAVLLFKSIYPELFLGVGNQELWRGLSSLAGSWIGGGANQNAMLEIYGYDISIYGNILLVDVVVANIWMAILLIGINSKEKINRWLKADNSSVQEMEEKVSTYADSVKRIPTLREIILLMALTFGGLAVAKVMAGLISNYLSTFWVFGNPKSYWSSFSNEYLWLVLLTTLIGVIYSTTKIRRYEGIGASKIGSLFIYILVASIGAHMNLREIFKNPELLLLGAFWIMIHIIILLVVARLIKAPYFFVAIGSQANIGGAASAPVVAAAFNSSLAPVGALLAILGYIVGTLGATVCAILMRMASA